jgi:outer membrane protein OmpA-like peptidoglycan-associated protein
MFVLDRRAASARVSGAGPICSLVFSVLGVACSGAPRAPVLEQPVGLTHDAWPNAAATAGPGLQVPAPGAEELVGTLPDALAYGSDGALCDLPDSPSEAIYFPTASTSLRRRGTAILDDVLACEKRGLFAGRGLVVIGYADPRGSSEYNRELGLRRAHAAADYLVRHGVPQRRIRMETRGEEDITAGNRDAWLFNRRVEIRLAGEDAERG